MGALRGRQPRDRSAATPAHLAYRTLDVEAAIEGHDVILEPFVVADGFLKAAFVLVDGAPIELMQYRDPNETGWYS